MVRRLTAIVVAVAAVILPLQPSAEATAAPNLLTLRSALKADPGPNSGTLSHVFADGVDGATVKYQPAGNAPNMVDFRGLRPNPNANYSEDVTIRVPRGLAPGSYAVGTALGQADISITTFGYGAPCDLDGGTIVVHDAAWTASDDPTRFAASLRLHCDGTSGGPLTYGEMRFGESTDTGATLGGVTARLVNQSVSYHATINSSVDIPYVVTNDGNAAVTPSRVWVQSQAKSAYPAWSITSDQCTGHRLAPGATCTFDARFAPKVETPFEYAYLSVDDGLPAPAVTKAIAQSDPLADQPTNVSAQSALHGIHVFFTRANSSDSHAPSQIAGYDVIRVNPDGAVGPVLASVDNYLAHGADVSDLADETAYTVAVRERFTDGTRGPLSAPVTASAGTQQLVYEVPDGGVEGGLFVRSDNSGDGVDQVSTWFDSLSVSPDGSLVAGAPHQQSSGSTTAIEVLAASGTAGARSAPSGASTTFNDSTPAFESPTSLLFARTVSGGSPTLQRWDLSTDTVTPIPGGGGLTDPAPAPDGAIVATDPAAKRLVTVTPAGTVSPIPGTDGASEATVSATGTIAYVQATSGLNTNLVLTDANGSSHTVVSSLPTGAVHAPQFVGDGDRLVVAIADTRYGSVRFSDLYAVTPASGAVENLTSTPNRDETAPTLTVAPRITVASTTSTARVALPDPDVPAPNRVSSVDLRLTDGDLAAHSPTDGAAVPVVSGAGTANGLTRGARYTVTAFYRNATGAVVSLGSRSFIAGVAPVVQFTAGPSNGSVVGPSSAPLVATGDADTDTIRCAVDGQTWSCPNGVLPTGSLPDGSHRFTATAVNAAGSGITAVRTLTVDQHSPTVDIHQLPVVTLGRNIHLTYSGQDNGSGVASYDVREKTAGYQDGFSAYRTPSGFARRQATSVSLPAPGQGTTVCLSVRARDTAGNVSAWTHDTCTTVPVDDRKLRRATRHWSSRTGEAFWHGTATRASRTQQTLSSAAYERGRVYLVVQACSRCGSVTVHAGSKRLGTVSLRVPGAPHRAIIIVPKRSRGGVLRLTTTAHRQVNIDALALLRG